MTATTIDKRVLCFLALIGWSEGTIQSPVTKNMGYDVIVSGEDGPSVFSDYSDHPFAAGRPPVVVRPGLSSTAAGRYQILLRWWEAYQTELNLPDFSPPSQDAVALQQITERHAIPMILAGNIAGAIVACSNIWASFPGNSYGQGGRTMTYLLTRYQNLVAAAESM